MIINCSSDCCLDIEQINNGDTRDVHMIKMPYGTVPYCKIRYSTYLLTYIRYSVLYFTTPHAWNPTIFFFPACLGLSSTIFSFALQFFSRQPLCAMEDERSAPGKEKKKSVSSQRKSLVCKFCSRPFVRLEHLQRHLRTRCVTLDPPPPIPQEVIGSRFSKGPSNV